MNSLYRFCIFALAELNTYAIEKQRTYRGRFETSIVRFVHQGIVKVISRCLALQSKMVEVFENCKCERGPGTSETCRKCKGNPVILRKSLRLAGGNPKNDISGYNT
jgi:hypothetical protein